MQPRQGLEVWIWRLRKVQLLALVAPDADFRDFVHPQGLNLDAVGIRDGPILTLSYDYTAEPGVCYCHYDPFRLKSILLTTLN